MSFVSTFLSHSSDGNLVSKVAVELGRRGVLAWLDQDELGLGPMTEALKKAVQQQATITLFLSKASSASAWCKDELRWALEAQKGLEHLLPVYLGDHRELVSQHELLRSAGFLNPDGRVAQKGVHVKGPAQPDPEAIANAIAEAVYQRTIPKDWHEVGIYLDQRGNGRRCGTPSLDAGVQRLGIPVLTFRPDRGSREAKELLPDWDQTTKTLRAALGDALGTLLGRTRKVYVLGHAQASLMWVLGRHFDRNTSVDLYAQTKEGLFFTNAGQKRDAPLAGGDPSRARHVHGPPQAPPRQVAGLGVGPSSYVADAKEALRDEPLFWIEADRIADSPQAMRLVEDLVAAVRRLHDEGAVRTIKLFWTTANAVAPLAAANLTSHLGVRLIFMERDQDAHRYVELPMP